MSVTSSINSVSKAQDFARQIASEVDTNKDGQVSTTEFGTFILNMFEGVSKGSTATSAFKSAMAGGGGTNGTSGTSALGFTPTFWGFDESRAISAAGSLKYDAYRILKNYDPRDPLAMRQAFKELDALHPGQYELDPQDNLMLTGTADGYIGARPVNRESDWFNRAQDWVWQWHGYNPAHPGPNGEVT